MIDGLHSLKRTLHSLKALGLMVMALSLLGTSLAQVPERNIDEIKAEAQARANRGGYPMGGLDPKDVEKALSLIKTRAGDDWAAGWSQVAESYVQEAQQSSDPGKAALLYKRAWRLFYMAQWPVPNAEGKKKAYANALSAYVQYARTLDPPLQVVQIPFEGKSFTGYLRMPKNTPGKTPMILAISGLDSRKETVADSYGEILSHGVGFLAVDSPGTGQAPEFDCRAHVFCRARLLGQAAPSRHPTNHCLGRELWRLLGQQIGFCRTLASLGQCRPVAAHRSIFH